METIDSLFFLLLILVMVYAITDGPFYSRHYQLSSNGFFKFLLLLIGIAWFFGGDDDDSCT